MIHLAKLLNKTDEEFIKLLESAGIAEKDINSGITQDEKILLIHNASKWSKKSWHDITPEENNLLTKYGVEWGPWS